MAVVTIFLVPTDQTRVEVETETEEIEELGLVTIVVVEAPKEEVMTTKAIMIQSSYHNRIKIL